MLLNDSYELDKDYEIRNDNREKQIADITRLNGIELVDSGINRLQKSDQGEYNNSNTNYKFNKFVKYNKLLEGNVNNPAIMAIYYEMQNNYDVLISKQMDKSTFDEQLNKIYHNELEFLETVYKYKKDNFNVEQQQQIEQEISKIKQLKFENKTWTTQLIQLFNLNFDY